MLNVVAWLELHRQKLITGFLAVVVVIGAIYLWRHFRAEAEARANAALLALRAKPGQPESAPKASDFLKVAEEHASTSVGLRARLLGAGAFFNENRYAEAQAEFERVLSAAGSGPLAAQALYGVAVSLDAQDKADLAAAKYAEVLSAFPEDSVAGQARLSLARLEERRGKPEVALKYADELLRARDAGAFSQQARQFREELVRRNPALAGTPAPSAP